MNFVLWLFCYNLFLFQRISTLFWHILPIFLFNFWIIYFCGFYVFNSMRCIWVISSALNNSSSFLLFSYFFSIYLRIVLGIDFHLTSNEHIILIIRLSTFTSSHKEQFESDIMSLKSLSSLSASITWHTYTQQINMKEFKVLSVPLLLPVIRFVR